MILLGYIIIYGYLFILLYLTGLLTKKNIIDSNVSRKLVHIGVSLCFIPIYYFLKNTIHIIIIPCSFIIINYISYKKDLFKGMETDNHSLGTVYYPISVLMMAILAYKNPEFYFPFACGLFIMGFADGLAPIIASKIKSKVIINEKTISGSLTIFIVSIIVFIILNYLFKGNLNIISIIILSISSVIFELIGSKGLDNLYLPLGICILTYFLGGL